MKHKSGLIFGLLAGTILGILFAPKKGRTLREAIKREREEGGYGLEAVKEGFVDMGRDMMGTAKEAYESEEVQEQIGRAKVAAAEMAEEGKKRVRKSAKKAARKVKRKATKTAKTASRKAGKFTKKKIG